jgi:LCCL domain-containing protein
MRAIRTTCWLALAVILFALAAHAAAQERSGRQDKSKPSTPAPSKESVKPGADAGLLEVRFTDNSTLKLALREPNLELATPYGKLLIPIEEIHRVEVGWRVAPEVLARVERAIIQLGSPSFKEREAASAELLGLKEKSFPAVVQATTHSDPEVARRAEEVLGKLREAVAEDILEAPAHDVVYTKDSKFTGHLTATVLKINTSQFGELQLKLTDVRGLRSLSAPNLEVEAKDVLNDPGSLSNHGQQIGKTFRFRVTGSGDGSLWGTGIYTTDSTLAKAAVHAGVLKVGQSGVVTVMILPAQAVYAGTTQNGVTSSDYGPYPSSFQIVKRRPGG